MTTTEETMMITIKLTKREAKLVWGNADGWLDAGACDGGLEPEERDALLKLCDQISRKIHKIKKGPLT